MFNKKQPKPLSFPEFINRYFKDVVPTNHFMGMPIHISGKRPDMVMFDDVEEMPKAIRRQFDNIETGFKRVAEDIEEVDDAVDDIDDKLDALMEYLKIEYVEETVTDGSSYGSTERSYMRKKQKKS